ncbi:MAG: zinc-binding dehydrogenase, partial [Fidelibacterota bacterium]
PSVSFETGAAVPVTYLTAYLMMINIANLKRGQTVLIHGIGGGVGVSALQMARILGAEVIGTASGWKHDTLRRMGADKLIDYTKEDFVGRTKHFTNGEGVDLVLDPLGGKNAEMSYRCLRPLGKVVLYGMFSAFPGKKRRLIHAAMAFLRTKRFHPLRLMNQNRGVLGCHLGHLWNEKETLRSAMTQLTEWLSDGKISPVVDRIFSFEEAPLAHRHIQDRKNIGKVILSPKL